MKYTKEERLIIGRKIYDGTMTKAEAAAKYGINIYTARDYLRVYKAYVRLMEKGEDLPDVKHNEDNRLKETVPRAKGYEDMSRQQMIMEIERLRELNATISNGIVTIVPQNDN